MAKTKSTTTLNLLDRIVLPSILKKEADYKTLILNKDINGKVQLSQAELKKYNIEFKGSQIFWNEAGDKAKFEIDFSEFEKIEIQAALKKLDDEKKLTAEYLNLYELFVK